MASEVVITSVPRGVKLGRTGFQVVMRTAGVSDGLLSSLEQLAGYRHVFPQGSGRNPLIYSYRAVRSPAGEVRVLGRTVDAGNDFSNRSNKLAHLLAVDSGELNALRNSSPAAVLAAIDGQLIQTWQGGPEERPSSFTLPTAPVQPAPCKRWRDVKGDAGWGGLLAQRAIQGQASLIVAPDCSPVWSRRLLDLFQEVLALLPPDSRWKATFETTVIGASSSILRGTYAGSPESAAGHSGLLVVDLSHMSPLPGTTAANELITLAREGRTKPMASSVPTLPSLSTPPALPSSDLKDALPQQQGGARLAGPAQQLRAPVAWDDDDEDMPRSRLGWYIGGGMVLFGAVLVSALLVGWYWFDDYTTSRLRKKIEDYAAITDRNDPGPEKTPTLADWKRAYRDDESIQSDAVGLQNVLSALRSKQIDATHVRDKDKRTALLRAAHAIAQDKPDQTKLVENARNLGLAVRGEPDDQHRNALALFVSSWLASDNPYKKDSPPGSLDLLQERLDLATEFVNAVLARPNGPRRNTAIAHSANRIWPDTSGDADPGRWADDFAAKLDPNAMDFTAISGVLQDARKHGRHVPSDVSPSQHATPSGGSVPARDSFEGLREALSGYKRGQPAESDSVELAKNIDIKDIHLTVSLPSSGKWTPTATPDPLERPTRWELKGTPDDPNAAWGTLILNSENGQLVFNRTIPPESECRNDILYVPLRFASADASPNACVDIVLADEERLRFAAKQGEFLADLIETGSSMLVTDKPYVSYALATNNPEAVEMSLAVSSTDGLKLVARTMKSPSLTVDVIANNPLVDDAASLRDIWVDSFVVSPADDNGYLAFTVARAGPKVHPWRALSESPNVPPSGMYTEEKWRTFVQATLNASVYADLHGPLDKKARPFIEQWLGGPPKNMSEKDERSREVNALEKKGIQSWHKRTCEFLFMPHSPYHGFTTDIVTEQQGDRPPDDPRPVKPREDAPRADRRDFEAKLEAWQENQRKREAWDQSFDERLRLSQSLIDFLKQPERSAETKSLGACRAAGVLVLELSAQNAKERTLNAMKKVPLASLFTAKITLPWKFGDDKECTVPRVTIEPCADSVPPNTSADIPSP